MGPITLFDKSFLQSLTVDESVWFGHFFSPVICPIFYVETLADLGKEVREGRTPEDEVRIIAAKFPDQSADPCAHHATMLVNDLLGVHVPLDGRIPMPRGRTVTRGERYGHIFEGSPEIDAFSRWQREEFLDIERRFARLWRDGLKAIDLNSLVPEFRKLGIDGRSCRSLEDARRLADVAANATGQHFAVAALLHRFLEIPGDVSREFLRTWAIAGYPALPKFAPYAAYVLSVELFFQVALAAGLIGAERSSNRVDIAYLNYLPFCNFFVSTDRLHQRCAPHFLREDQRFIWGSDLKADLARINAHFLTLPESERECGLSKFAPAPPKLENSLVRSLRAQVMGPDYDDRPPTAPPADESESTRKLFDEIKAWEEAPSASGPLPEHDDGHGADMVLINRTIRKKRGSWWQWPKDLKSSDND